MTPRLQGKLGCLVPAMGRQSGSQGRASFVNRRGERLEGHECKLKLYVSDWSCFYPRAWGDWGVQMTTRATIAKVIDQAYRARETGDIESIVAVFHPDARFELVGSKTHTPAVAAAYGHQELRDALAGLIPIFDFVQPKIISTLIDGERAAVYSRVELGFVPKDKTVTTDFLDMWKFDNGLVVELLEFFDTALVNDLMSSGRGFGESFDSVVRRPGHGTPVGRASPGWPREPTRTKS